MSLDYEQSQYLNEQEARSNSFPWFSWGHVFSRLLSFASYLNWWKGKRDYSQPIPGMQSCIIGLLSWYCNHDLILVRFGITFLEDLKIFNMHKPCRLDYLLLFGKVSPCSSSGLERILDLREWWKSSLQTMSQILSNLNCCQQFSLSCNYLNHCLGHDCPTNKVQRPKKCLSLCTPAGRGISSHGAFKNLNDFNWLL